MSEIKKSNHKVGNVDRSAAMAELQDIRDGIDNIDASIIHMLAERYRGRDASYLAPPAQIRTGPIRAYGLYGAFFVKGASRDLGRPLHSILLFDPRREGPFLDTPEGSPLRLRCLTKRERRQQRRRTARDRL